MMLTCRSSFSGLYLRNNSVKNFSVLGRHLSSIPETSATNPIPSGRIKHKVPQKRASYLLSQLKVEHFQKLKNGREWPQIYAGDSVRIERFQYLTAKEPSVLTGVVISKTNRASDTAITIANVESGTPVIRRIILYSPFIKDIQVLQRAFIHKGKKRVRRSKIYYLLDRDPKEFTVS